LHSAVTGNLTRWEGAKFLTWPLAHKKDESILRDSHSNQKSFGNLPGTTCSQEKVCVCRLMCLLFFFFLSENIDNVMQDDSNFCHSCQDIIINSVSNFNSLKPGVLYSSTFLKCYSDFCSDFISDLLFYVILSSLESFQEW
jgi:hypothetical protein